MSIHPADEKAFKIVDNVMFYAGEIIAAVIFLFPLVCVIYGIIWNPREGANAHVFARNIFEVISLIGSISGVVFIWAMITMRVSPKVIFILGGFAFIYAMYLGFGFGGMIIMAVSICILFFLNLIPAVHDPVVRTLNYVVSKFELAGFWGKNGSFEKLMYEYVDETDIGRVAEKHGFDLKIAAFISAIVLAAASILAYEVYLILFSCYKL
jgi:hypothetical protein